MSREDGIISSVISAVQSAAWARGLVLLGSFGSSGATPSGPGSDLDLLLLTKDPNLPLSQAQDLLQELLFEAFPPAQRLLCLRPEGKVVLFLAQPRLLKLDFGLAAALEDKARFLRGSEGARVLLDNSEDEGLSEELRKLMETKAWEALDDYSSAYHVERFLEMFELLCKSLARKDVYRVEFYVFILRHSLLVLELIGRGEREHLYLPKQAFGRADPRGLPAMPLPTGEAAQGWVVAEGLRELYLKLREESERKQQEKVYLDAVISHYASLSQ